MISKRAKLLAIYSILDLIKRADPKVWRFTIASLVACGVTLDEFLEACDFSAVDEELVTLTRELLENAERLASQKVNN